ncbi:unnamed protein product [Microthlaspi erraticum]|uniref:HSF-type DNA-binding domain-containing protein n=1 Tax=Microthlaspi erraticum TaxID=1685480 RepID=A0A6D2J873_9BRAS|nr:unnamed protein product [Microthlaspi erraticum]
MVKQNGCGTIASRIGHLSLLDRVYQMVDDPSTNSIISWSQSGKSFIVWDPLEFSRDLLERIFSHHDFSLFIQKLNHFGFRKVDSSEQWEFADDEFVKGEPERVGNIYRRLDSDSDSDAKPSVTRLKTMKTVVMKRKIKPTVDNKTMKRVEMKKKIKLRVNNKKASKAVGDQLQGLRI